MKRAPNDVPPTMPPIYKLLAYDSELNNVKVYGLRALCETTAPLATERYLNCGTNNMRLDI